MAESIGREKEDVFILPTKHQDEELDALLSRLQEANISSSRPHDRKSENGESSSYSLKIEDNNSMKEIGNSQMKSSTSMDFIASAGDDLIFCEVCMENKPKKETRVSTSKCSHLYCSECISKHIATKVQENIIQITCLEHSCKEALEPHLCKDIIPGEVFDRWEDALCESSILALHKFYCPFKDCSGMLVNDDDGVIIREAECPYCNRLFCAQCKVPWHSDMDCRSYQDEKNGGRKEDELLVKLAEIQKWRRCPSCKYYVEKKEGCMHITCRCTYEFCYSCGIAWSSSHSPDCRAV